MQIFTQICLAISLLLHPNTVSLDELKPSFKVLVPKNISNNLTLEIKTYPMGEKTNISYIRLHYLDEKGKLVFGLQEAKSSDEENDTSHVQGEKIIDVNGNKAYFAAWVPAKEDKKGGILWWIQGDTYIKMTSFKLTEDELLNIARSMK